MSPTTSLLLQVLSLAEPQIRPLYELSTIVYRDCKDLFFSGVSFDLAGASVCLVCRERRERIAAT